jgi:hypothetical protein
MPTKRTGSGSKLLSCKLSDGALRQGRGAKEGRIIALQHAECGLIGKVLAVTPKIARVSVAASRPALAALGQSREP